MEASESEPATDELSKAFLASMAQLDLETDALNAMSPDAACGEDEDLPDWLTQAAEAVEQITDSEPLPAEWDEHAAVVQGAVAQATEAPSISASAEPGNATHSSSMNVDSWASDAGALAWLDAQLVPIVARSFPHLERLMSSPSLGGHAGTADRDFLARELLHRRDVLLVRERHGAALTALPVAVHALGLELRNEEELSAQVRRGASRQVRGHEQLHVQLELTKSAAEATSRAARQIADDHQRDVAALLEALRKGVGAEAAASVEAKLSASQTQLLARKRHAHAQQKHAEAVRRGSTTSAAPAQSEKKVHAPTRLRAEREPPSPPPQEPPSPPPQEPPSPPPRHHVTMPRRHLVAFTLSPSPSHFTQSPSRCHADHRHAVHRHALALALAPGALLLIHQAALIVATGQHAADARRAS